MGRRGRVSGRVSGRRTLRVAPWVLFTTFTTLCMMLVPVGAWSEGSLFYHHSQLVALYPQEAGSQNEKIVIDYIVSVLRSSQVEYEVEDYTRGREWHSFSHNIYVNLIGASPETLTVAVTYNTSSLNIALALALIEHYREHTPPIGIQFVFLGDEIDRGRYTGVGTRLYLSNSRRAHSVAVVHLDVSESTRYVSLDIGDGEWLTPAWMLQDIRRALSEGALALRLPFMRATTLRNQTLAGLSTEKEGSLPATVMEAGVPAVSIVSFEGAPLETPTPETLLSIEEYFVLMTTIVTTVAERGERGWDSNYIVLPWILNSIVIEETPLLILLISLFIGVALFMVYRTRFIHTRYIQLLKKHWWNTPVMLLIIYLSVVLASVVVRLATLLHPVDEIWRYRTLWCVALAALVAYFFFRLAHRVIIARTKRLIGRYSSVSAILISLTGTLVISSINLAYSVVMIWVTLCSLIFMLLSTRNGKMVVALVSTLAPLLFVAALLSRPDTHTGEAFFYSPFSTGVLVMLIVAPVYYMFRRLYLIQRFRIPSVLRVKVPVLLLVVVGGFLRVTHPFDAEYPQPIYVEERIQDIPYRHSLQVRSPARFGDVDLVYGNERIRLEKQRTLQQVGLAGISPVTIEHISLDTNDLNFHSFEIVSERDIASLDIGVASNSGLQVDGSTYPITTLYNGLQHVIHVGNNPPVPLVIEFYTDRSADFSIRFEAHLREPLMPIGASFKGVDTTDPPVALTTDTQVIITLDIE